MTVPTHSTLTAEQEAIVAYPMTPLRVAAGAGTGKTTTVALRLKAQIIAGIHPEEALCVTFTNKAAEELADRLRGELPDLARDGREVQVTTYHGFAFGLLQEFGALVGVERNAAVIGPGFARQLIEESLGTGTYHHLDLTAVPQRVADAAALGRQLGDNLRVPSDVIAAAPPPERRGDVWHQRIELAAAVAAYDNAKARTGVVDYGDLVRLAHRLVAENPAIAARIRSRYRTVLLDEYQDTDAGQRLLLRSLFGDGFPITAVGDTDQTIYEWRGASRHNFAGFPEHFPDAAGVPAATFPLTLNRRSDRLVIDLANRIRDHIGDPDPSGSLQAAPGAGPGSVEVAWLRTEREEADWIADRIRSLHDGVLWSDVAVLVRKNKSIGPIRDALLATGIPVDVVSLGGLLAVPEVTDLHAWLRVLNDPEDSAALARILLGGKYRLGLADMVPLRRWVLAHRVDLRHEDDEVGWPLVEAIDRLDEVDGLSGDAYRRLNRFRDLYRRLLVEAQGTSLVELCRRVLTGIDAWTEANALEEHAALSARLNLYRFLDLAEGWSPLEGRPSLGGFLGYLDILEDEIAAEELDTATVSREDAVSVLTVHRAKGLEWDIVFLPALAKGTFPAGSQGFDNPVDFPRYLPYGLRIDAAALPDLSAATKRKERSDILRPYHENQEWRTAYVAATRARHRLVLSGAFWIGNKTPQERSALLELASDLPGSEQGRTVVEPGPRPDPAPSLDRDAAPDALFPDGWAKALREASQPDWLAGFPEHASTAEEKADQLRLALDSLPEPIRGTPATQFVTSVTGLVTMARCPRQFRWAHVDRLPRRPAPGLRRGVEFHRRLELHNLGRVPFEDLDDQTYDLPDAPPRHDGDSSPFSAFLSSRFAATRPLLVETPIDLLIGSVRVRGRIDAVYEPAAGAWEIVDYKSGVRRDEPSLRVQLQAYAIAAADGAVTGGRPQRLTVSFAYFGGGELEEVTEVVDERWLTEARERLDLLADRAVAADFPATPSAACRGCDFLAFCEEGRRFVAGSR